MWLLDITANLACRLPGQSEANWESVSPLQPAVCAAQKNC